jgi:molybdate transport system substrate-binding protein
MRRPFAIFEAVPQREQPRRAIISLLLFSALLSFTLPVATRAQEVRAAVAADLQFTMQDLSAQFEKQSATKVNVTYGSSGNFFSQIQNGAPFDLFFSADLQYAQKLEAAGLVEPGTLYKYAVGRIVVWAPSDSKVDLTRDGWSALLDAAVRKIAIASPDHAPYGRAAVAALKNAGIYDRVAQKLVYGENISQAAQFVQSGNAQAGILALSLAISPAMKNGKRWDVPADLYPPLEQAAVILKSATNKPAARAFLAFVASETGRATLSKYGFAIPETAGPSASASKN